jgi:hypothetical protein
MCSGSWASPRGGGKLVFQEADNSYVQDWHYPEKGIDLSMSPGDGAKDDCHHHRLRALYARDPKGNKDWKRGERGSQGLRHVC